MSVMLEDKDRRLGAALPVYKTTLGKAFYLIGKVGVLARCHHGQKMGTLIEPKAPNWPLENNAEGSLEHLEELKRLFEFENSKLELDRLKSKNPKGNRNVELCP